MNILKRKKTDNITFIVFLLIVVIGYGCFFTSKMWIPNARTNVTVTPLGEENNLDNRVIKIIRWDYSEEQRLCEVELDVNNKKYDGIDTYDYQAIERTAGELEIETVIENEDYVVLHISMPKRWKEVSFRMSVPGSSEILKMYATIKSVNRVETIQKLSFNQYMVRHLEDSIVFYQDEIDRMNDEVTTMTQMINEINDHILQLEAKKQFQTDQEIEETNLIIKDANMEKENTLQSIEKKKADIEEYKQRIQKTLEQIEEISSEEQN